MLIKNFYQLLSSHLKKNIYIFGSDLLNENELTLLTTKNKYQFHKIVNFNEVTDKTILSLDNLYELCLKKINKKKVDAIICFWDFPFSTMLPLLTKAAKVFGPSLTNVLNCEHKYLSRCLQQACIKQHIPKFVAVNPFEDLLKNKISLAYPFWLKPIKSYSSCLGFRVENDSELLKCQKIIQKNIKRVGNAFNYLLNQAQLPEFIKPIDGLYCIAEELISEGHQCTQEGYVHHNDITIYGTVDTLRYLNDNHHSCLKQYRYPSTLPNHVIKRMSKISKIVISYLGYNNGLFNIEYFWNEKSNKIKLLEINPRFSRSHCDLFRLVDGNSHHLILIEIALGLKPSFKFKLGSYPYAAKFMLRHFKDGFVKQIPSKDQLREIYKRFPDITIVNKAILNTYLHDMKNQDSYSYEIARIFLGANSPLELETKYEKIKQSLDYIIE